MALPLPFRRQAQEHVLRTVPGVGLKAARETRCAAEKLLDQGQDLAVVREARRYDDEKRKHTFRAVGDEWATNDARAGSRTTTPRTWVVRYALKLIALTMVRPGELRLAEWTEFDEKNLIRLIPAEKMKMRDNHEVPLSRQVRSCIRR